MLERRSVIAGIAGWMIVPAAAVHAWAWPSQPVKLVVPYAPGGASDALGRVVPLPYRLVAFELGEGEPSEVEVHDIQGAALYEQLERLDHDSDQKRKGLYVRSVSRVYDGSTGVPTIFVLKPDMARYWTRSTALSDGDEVALDMFRWQQASSSKGTADDNG